MALRDLLGYIATLSDLDVGKLRELKKLLEDERDRATTIRDELNRNIPDIKDKLEEIKQEIAQKEASDDGGGNHD